MAKILLIGAWQNEKQLLSRATSWPKSFAKEIACHIVGRCYWLYLMTPY
jgi:hypothetical protein